ncbi:solute carrier organic anion transporter family member 1A6-like [Gastrophryne carolinensis]
MAVEKDTNEADHLTSSAAVPDHNVTPVRDKRSCCASLKVFLVALCFSYFAKAFSGSYMKSSITQIERRFDISSSMVGLVDGGFELGNLLVIVAVSFFGAKLHRPRMIAAGCFVMSLGSFLTAAPHFFMGTYKYETARTPAPSFDNLTNSVSPCAANQTLPVPPALDCNKETNYMWVYVMIGNMLRGIGETPITPLGLSYIDDFARPENTALYLAFLHAVSLFGPMAGFMLSSYTAKLFVDIGFVDMDTVTITPQDSRWVGAWWVGFLLAGIIHLLSGIPFCFIPRNAKNQEAQQPMKEKEGTEPQKMVTVKDFLLALKALACNKLFVLLQIMTLLQFNSFLGFLTYKPKYMEQQYGQSTSRSNFITGVSTLPAAALGIFLGGLIMKKYKMDLLGASKMGFGTSLLAFLLSLSVFILGCENNDIAGITVSYSGRKLETFRDYNFLSSCNMDCQCSSGQWDPVCGDNKVTYMSACLAGCKASSGTGKDIVYHNCSCIESMGFSPTNSSASLGACPRSDNCSRMFMYYVISQILTSFVFALGGTAIYVIILWSVKPELKSLAVGVFMLLVRTLAGIPAPIYFGALIDRTCLKWGTRFCGGKGACRLYDAESFRKTFLGLITGIRAPSYILYICFIYLVKKRLAARSPEDGVKQDGGTEKEACPEGETAEDRRSLGVERESKINIHNTCNFIAMSYHTTRGPLRFYGPRARTHMEPALYTLIIHSFHRHCSATLKIFLFALSFAYITKSLAVTYSRSMITQIERRFNIPSKLVGVIDGSFDIGCAGGSSESYMWMFVLVGNILQGIGETPVEPLGLSYVDDFAKVENSPFYIGIIQTLSILGPLLGSLMASYFAELFVDIGFINLDEVFLRMTDTRWVGAWWLGFLVSGALNLLAAVPFCFLPRTLPKEGEEGLTELRETLRPQVTDNNMETSKTKAISQGFLHVTWNLLRNQVYMLFVLVTILQFSAFIGFFSFTPKFLEQQYGISASDAIFLIGVYSLPVIAVGYFLGGFCMKRYKVSTLLAAKLGFFTSITEYLLYIVAFWLACKNANVAGLTVTYDGIEGVSYLENLTSDCNVNCGCPSDTWDPVCGDNAISYASACLAGCSWSNGTGQDKVFYNCSCVLTENATAAMGQCPREERCGSMLLYFLILNLVCCLIYSMGAMPGYMVLIRSLTPEEKSFGLGLHLLAARAIGGIPSPIYYGAAIDTTCIKWGTNSCGEPGACRMYDSDAFRYLYIGFPTAMRFISYIPCVIILLVLRRKHRTENAKGHECH